MVAFLVFVMSFSTEVELPVLVKNLAEQFLSAVSIYQPENEYRQIVLSYAQKKLNQTTIIERQPQIFFLADSNPNIQLIMLGYWDGKDKVVDLGWDLISTGNPSHGKDYHYTPLGIFANTLDNFSFRAVGTKNEKGWRGYGIKGMRVWDFGWQTGSRPVHHKIEQRTIRLLMHATDPDGGEPKLGTPQSKGCIRISQKLNIFIDKYCLLDAEYLKAINNRRVAALLATNKEPFLFAGKWLMIINSSELIKN